MGMSEEESKNEFIEILQNLHEESGNKWRIRDTIAKHMFEYTIKFSPDIVFKKIWGLIMLLCTDNVYQVRSSIAKSISKVLNQCKNEEYINIMCSDLQVFAAEEKWGGRQFFSVVCSYMWEIPCLFENIFLAGILKTCEDPIIGVRIASCNALKNLIEKNGITTTSIIYLIYRNIWENRANSKSTSKS